MSHVNARREVDTFYSADGEREYLFRPLTSGWAVYRGDGSYAEFLESSNALEAAELLANGDKDESDYYWTD